MSDIYFRYLADTRTLQDQTKRYAGQQFDAGSMRMHFEYDPLNYLGLEDYTAYIIFNVPGPDGNPMVYGPNSTPRFDGYVFDIPWEVTSRAKRARIEFQLWLVKSNIIIDDTTQMPQLESTDYELSSISGIALKNSICPPRKCDPCGPMNPGTEPSLVGMMNVFMQYGVMRPVDFRIDEESKKLELVFRSYYGEEQKLELPIPTLDEDGTIDESFLPFIQSWFDEKGMLIAGPDMIPSAELTYNALNEKSDKAFPVPLWNAGTAYQVGALVIWNNVVWRANAKSQNVEPGKDSTWLRLMDTALIATNLSNPMDVTVPSTSLLKAELDRKFDKDGVVNDWAEATKENVPSAILVADAMDSVKEHADGKVSDSWDYDGENNLPTDVAPSERLVKEALDTKTDIAMAIPEWSESVEYSYQSTVIYEGTVYISTADGNLDKTPGIEDIWWTPISATGGTGGSGTATQYTYMAVIGDGETTDFTIEHPLGTENVLVNLRGSSDRVYVRSTIQVLDESRIKVTFRHAPKRDSIVVLIASFVASPDAIVTKLGNGTDTIFYITHNWGTYNVFAQLRDVTDGMLVYADIVALNPSVVQVEFAKPPAQDSLVLSLAPCIPSASVEGYTYTQTAPSDTWVINHNLNRVVSVYVMTLDGEEMDAYVKQDMVTLDSVTVQFSEPVTGIAYLR